jgi:hypothetical protein
MKESIDVTQKTSADEVLRFAQPFYTDVPIEQRPIVDGIGTRMTDYIKTLLEPIPDPHRDPTMMLSEIIGSKGVTDIQQAGVIKFHAVGDTFSASGNMQLQVANAMAADYDPAKPATSPAFFFHLGDVIYYDNTDKGYHAQFYEPYKTYPGKIIAIPGNHDGELFKYDGTSTGQSVTLEAFQKNFCQAKTGVPPAAGTIYREMISQPAVYWYLNTPFVDIIGLYSNMAENPGYISAPSIGNKQKDWLTKTLKSISAARAAGSKKALLIATHHPPFSTGAHSSSTEMLIDIDDCCTQASIMPDAFLSAHAHNLQCYTRYITFGGKNIQIPFIVCGGGGRQIQQVPAATGSKVTDQTTLKSYHTFDKSLYGYSYLTVTASLGKLTIQVFEVNNSGAKSLFNTINVKLK